MVLLVRIALVVAGGAVAVWLAFRYGLVLLAREYVNWAFVMLKPALPFVRVFAFKRTMQLRPERVPSSDASTGSKRDCFGIGRAGTI